MSVRQRIVTAYITTSRGYGLHAQHDLWPVAPIHSMLAWPLARFYAHNSWVYTRRVYARVNIGQCASEYRYNKCRHGPCTRRARTKRVVVRGHDNVNVSMVRGGIRESGLRQTCARVHAHKSWVYERRAYARVNVGLRAPEYRYRTYWHGPCTRRTRTERDVVVAWIP